MDPKQIIKFILIFLAILSIIALISSIWLGFANSFRLVFGIIYVLFIPGFVWSYVFFRRSGFDADTNADTTLINSSDEKNDGIDWVERIILSIALSLALVPLVIFFVNKIGVKINLLSVMIEIFGIILIGVTIIVVKNYISLSRK
ncbi:MAG: DUF1616 domain-containing protein [Patescibacteria group bacterium]|jgi:uncharacterized membrane protein